MRKGIVLVVLLAVILVGGWLALGGGAARVGAGAHGGGEASSSPVTVALSRSEVAAEAAAASVRRKPVRPEAKAEREAMRRRILEALDARERAAGERSAEGSEPAAGSAESSRAPTEAPKLDPTEPDEGEPAVGTLIDRTGTHAEHVKVINEDLMPLVDECYALARHTQPELAGMLVLNFELIGDEDIGGVIESVELGLNTEMTEPSLVECVQESILATTLPPPEEGGRDEISLSLRLEPDEVE